jgi:hypothetical protein
MREIVQTLSQNKVKTLKAMQLYILKVFQIQQVKSYSGFTLCSFLNWGFKNLQSESLTLTQSLEMYNSLK